MFLTPVLLLAVIGTLIQLSSVRFSSVSFQTALPMNHAQRVRSADTVPEPKGTISTSKERIHSSVHSSKLTQMYVKLSTSSLHDRVKPKQFSTTPNNHTLQSIILKRKTGNPLPKSGMRISQSTAVSIPKGGSSTRQADRFVPRKNVPPKKRTSLPLDVIDRVKTFVIFVGYPRSGHSIIGSMMDAHPNMVIAHELFLFDWWSNIEHDQRNVTKSSIFRAIYRSSSADSVRGWRNGKENSKGYSLELDYPWQGRYNGTIQVIGDKSGGNTAHAYMVSPNQFRARYHHLLDVVGIPVRVIHVVRNPFDIISTTALYEKGKKEYPGALRGSADVSKFVHGIKARVQEIKNRTINVDEIEKEKLDDVSLLRHSITNFFELADAVKAVIELVGLENVLEVHNYELVNDSATTMLKICDFLGLHCPDDYLQACVRKTFRTLSVSRDYVVWRKREREIVEEAKLEYPFFHRYSFDGEV